MSDFFDHTATQSGEHTIDVLLSAIGASRCQSGANFDGGVLLSY